MVADAQNLARALKAASQSKDWRGLLDWISREEGAADPAVIAQAQALLQDLDLTGAPSGLADLAVVALGAGGRAIAANPMGGRIQHRLDEEPAHSALAEARRSLARGAKAAFVDLSGEDARLYAVLLQPAHAPGVWSAACGARAPAPGEAVLVVSAPEDQPSKWPAIQSAFGLTPAELRLARRLDGGETLREAADALGVAFNTVRVQVRSLMEKVGVRRQAELLLALKQFEGLLSAVGPAISGTSPAAPYRPFAVGPGLRLFVLPDGRRMAYRDYGPAGGRPALLFHDSMGSSLALPSTDDIASALDLRLIVPERPGFGQSDPSPAYSFGSVAADYLALAEGIGAPAPRLLGVAAGGAFALAAAQQLGPRYDRLMLVSARGLARLPDTRGGSFLQRYRRDLMASPWFTETMLSLYTRLYSRDFLAGSLRRSTAGAPRDRAFVDANPQVLDYLVARGFECFARGAKGPAADMACYRTAATGPVAAPPGLVLWHGEADDSAPLAELRDGLAGDYELRTFPEAGHLLALQVWPEILRRIARD